MAKNSTKQSFIFQITYQAIILLIPLILSPYLTRVLGKENLGIYSYTNSIAYYFIIAANLGISKYGQRLIALHNGDRNKIRSSFWSLYFDHALMSILCIGMYAIFCCFSSPEYKSAYFIEIIYVVSALFDITWLFYGLENFKGVVIKNAIVKVIECACIFLFVKNTNDIYIYILIMSISTLISQLTLFPYVLRKLPFIKFSKSELISHWKPMLVLFISVVASTLYTVFDKTLLGLMIPDDISNVAIYEYANKIVNIPKSILAVFGTIMFPKACMAVAEGNTDKQRKYMEISYFLISLIGSAFTFGLIAIANKFTYLYYGEEFVECGKIVAMMSPLILIIILGDVFRYVYLVPLKKDWTYIIGLCIAAVTNIIASIIFINICGVYGAVIGTLIGETVNFIYEFIATKKVICIKQFLLNVIPFILFGIIMWGCVYLIDRNTPTTISYLILEICAGAVIYVILSVTYCMMFCRDKVKALLPERFKR